MNRPPARRARGVVLSLWLMLSLTLVAWHLQGLGAAAAAVAVLFTVGPLLLPLPGLLQGDPRTYRWATLTLAPALAWSLTELVANPAARWPATAVALLSVLSLAALVAALRVTPQHG